MVGKLITLAIVAVLLYGLYLRLKVKFTENLTKKFLSKSICVARQQNVAKFANLARFQLSFLA